MRSLSCHQGVSLSLRPGELVAVLAPPGGGKSSLVAAALGLRPLAGGTVLLDGIPLTPHSDPALRQQVTHTGHPRAATATPRSPSIPCCCPPVTKPLKCVSMATLGNLLSPTGPHSHPWVCTWSSAGPHCYPQVTPVPQMGPYCLPKVTTGCLSANPGVPNSTSVSPGSPVPSLLSPVGYHGYPQVTHCPNIHDRHVTLCSQHIPTATPRSLLCSQQFFIAILISSASLTTTLPPPHVSTHPLLVPARFLCGPMLPHVPCPHRWLVSRSAHPSCLAPSAPTSRWAGDTRMGHR